MPYLIGNNLIIRILHDKANCLGLSGQRHLVQRRAPEKHGAAADPPGGEYGFEMAQKGGFPAPAGSAQKNKLPFLNGKGNILQAVNAGIRIGKAQVSNLNLFHSILSRRYITGGIRSIRQYAGNP